MHALHATFITLRGALSAHRQAIAAARQRQATASQQLDAYRARLATIQQELSGLEPALATQATEVDGTLAYLAADLATRQADAVDEQEQIASDAATRALTTDVDAVSAVETACDADLTDVVAALPTRADSTAVTAVEQAAIAGDAGLQADLEDLQDALLSISSAWSASLDTKAGFCVSGGRGWPWVADFLVLCGAKVKRW